MEFYETLIAPTHGEFTKVDGDVAKRALRVYTVDGSGKYTFATFTEDTEISTGVKLLKTVNGYVKDSRTGEDASYIPDQKIWDLDAYNAAKGTEYREFRMQHVLVLGKDALIRTGITGQDNAKMYTKALGSAGVLDPIDQRQSIGFKINDVGFGSARLEAVTDYICVPSMANLI
jgi:hypothetical protein